MCGGWQLVCMKGLAGGLEVQQCIWVLVACAYGRM